MAHAKEEVEFFVLTEAQKDLLISLDASGSISAHFEQFVELPGFWCIRADTLKTWDDQDADLYDFTEELWMDFDMQSFVMSTMHPM